MRPSDAVVAYGEEVADVGFEVFKKGSAPVPKVPAVTVQRRGLISLNRAAYDLIGAPEAVELLWDAERSLIGIRATELTNPNAYPARQQTAKSGRGPILIAGTLFTQFIGLDTAVAFRWVPTMEDEILCVDVSKPGQQATSNRVRSAKRTSDAETSSIPAASSAEGIEEGTRQPVRV
jgi:hypothetical protein